MPEALDHLLRTEREVRGERSGRPLVGGEDNAKARLVPRGPLFGEPARRPPEPPPPQSGLDPDIAHERHAIADGHRDEPDDLSGGGLGEGVNLARILLPHVGPAGQGGGPVAAVPVIESLTPAADHRCASSCVASRKEITTET